LLKGKAAMMSGYFGWMGAAGGIGMLVGALVWVAVIVLLVWGIGSLFGHRTTDTDTQSEALDILKRRYAAGEITSAELETARRALA
jgi:uncharacterized membrane protein